MSATIKRSHNILKFINAMKFKRQYGRSFHFLFLFLGLEATIFHRSDGEAATGQAWARRLAWGGGGGNLSVGGRYRSRDGSWTGL